MRKRLRRLLLVAGTFVAASLVSLYSYGRFAERAQGAAEQALPVETAATQIDRFVTPLLDAHPNESGMLLLPDNVDAFVVRAESARASGRSLDLQYYIWNADLTGNLLGYELLRAADRGVRVRLLLDDLSAHTKDSQLAALDQHPLIEVRLFNPARSRKGHFMRALETMFRVVSMNRRMHNKAWIVDGRVAVVGGRNIGNEYFDADPEVNFMDTDVAVIGPVVEQAESNFDRFWNSRAVIPLAALVQADPDALQHLRENGAAGYAAAKAQPYVQQLTQRENVRGMLDRGHPLWWTEHAEIHSDPPEKALGEDREHWLMPVLFDRMRAAQHDLTLISPYFVPGKGGVAEIRGLRERGVTVGILTNSLMANDVVAVHGGYAKYRKPLLEAGVQLYELKAEGERRSSSLFGSSGASLHTKAFVVDGNVGFVGSFNLDPRSAKLNTEMGLLFEDDEAAAALQAMYAQRTSPAVSYRLWLDDGDLRWNDDAAQPPVIWKHEPEASLWMRWKAKVIGWLPIESQL